jgi:uncharacterized membrane protein YcfT
MSGPKSLERLPWIDTARGLAIVLVALMHATDWLQETPIRLPLWHAANDILATLRMPLLFLCAGILGRKYVTAPWPEVASRKVSFLFWVYLIWQPIGSLMVIVAAGFNGDELSPFRMLVAFALSPVRPRFELWFIWALALFFALARLSVRQPLVRQFAVSGALSALWFSSLIPNSNIGWDGLAKYYVFFLLGCYGRTHLLGFADRLTPLRALTLLSVWLGLATAGHVTGWDAFPGIGFALRVAGVLGGIALARLLQRVSLLGYLGSRSLEIYLAHTAFIIVFTWLLNTQLEARWLTAVTPALPLALALASVWLALRLHAGLLHTPARVLYKPPASVTEWVRSRLAARAGSAPAQLAPSDTERRRALDDDSVIAAE